MLLRRNNALIRRYNALFRRYYALIIWAFSGTKLAGMSHRGTSLTQLSATRVISLFY